MIALRSRPGLVRWYVFGLVCACYGCTVVGALVFLSLHTAWSTSWTWFLLTSVISCSYFGVGCLVWGYARHRLIAALFLLLCACLAISLVLAVPSEMGNNAFIHALSSLSASVGIFFLLLLVLHFPHQVLRSWRGSGWRMRILWGWLVFLGALSAFSACYCLTGTRLPPAAWFEPWYMIYYLGTTLSLLGVLIAATRMRLSRRERQQLRLLFTGIGAGFAPWLCLSILPDLLHSLLPTVPIVSISDYWTIPSLLLHPLTLGYTVLRYQFLVFDVVVARVVCWVLRGMSLALCIYLGLTYFLLVPHTLDYLLAGAVASVGLSLGLWVLAQRITTGLLFAEVAQDRHLIMSTLETPAQTRDLPTVARTVQRLVGLTCGSQDAFLFVRDEASGLYRLVEEPSATARERLDQVLDQLLDQRYPAPPLEEFSLTPTVHTRLLHARRPSFLGELIPQANEVVFLAGSAQMVLVGLAEAGVLQGLLVLDVRRDQQPYAGADFEALHALVTRVRPILTAALHHSTKTAQTEVLEEALHQTTLLSQRDPEDFTAELATLLARFVPAQVEVWERREHLWYRLALAGAHTDAWSTEQTRRFLAQNMQRQMPLFEAQGVPGHSLPLALLSLEDDPSHLSRVLAQYARPSLFLPERRQMFLLATLHARRMLQEARARVPGEVGREGTFSPALVAALHTLSETMEREGAFDMWRNNEGRMRLGEQWQAMQTLLAQWVRPVLLPRSRVATSSISGIVLLVMQHPLLAEMLADACEVRGCAVVVRQSIRECLQWLQQAPRSLAAVILDDAVLSLDLDVFVHAVMEYVPALPLIIVCSAHPPVVDELRPSTKVAFLPKPFALAQFFHLFGWDGNGA